MNRLGLRAGLSCRHRAESDDLESAAVVPVGGCQRAGPPGSALFVELGARVTGRAPCGCSTGLLPAECDSRDSLQCLTQS